MDTKGCLGQVSIVDITLLEETFHVSAEPPKEAMEADIDLSNPQTHYDVDQKQGLYIAQALVSTGFILGEHKSRIARVQATATCTVLAVMSSQGVKEEVAHRQLRQEAVSAAYAFERTRIAEKIKLSPVGHFELPNVDVAAVLRKIDAAGQSQAGSSDLASRLPQI